MQKEKEFLPYSIHTVDNEDRDSVRAVLESNWLTTGPKVDEFERRFAEFVSSAHAIAVNSGTAALHAALHACKVSKGQEVIVSPLTFAATANAVLYAGGVPVFADVEPDTLLIDPAQVARQMNDRTVAVIAVDYAGHPADYLQLGAAIESVDSDNVVRLIADACHALGASARGIPVGSLADLSCFSFHPVKHITTGEGGMITTNDPDLARRMRVFRNHGISTEHREREKAQTHFYDMVDLGFNYRLNDIQCALGISQLRKSEYFSRARRRIAQLYDQMLATDELIRPLTKHSEVEHGYHLYVVRITNAAGTGLRDRVFTAMRANQIGVNVHYRPVYLHSYYRETLGYQQGLCPNAETAYQEILSLPIFPRMTEADVERVVATLRQVLQQEYRHNR